MNQHAFLSNIPRFMWYRSLRGFSFGLIVAMWVIYLQRQYGLNLTEVTLFDVGFWVAATLGELPTGVVADSFGRKTSLLIGGAIMALSILVWAFAPTVALTAAAYVVLALGTTFISGADDAFFFESLQITGRADDYTRLSGRISAISMGFAALGNVTSGLFAAVDLRLPFIVAGVSLLVMLVIISTFKEPNYQPTVDAPPRKSYSQILRETFALMRVRPTVLYPMLFLSFVPMAAVIAETVFLQPQAVALGVPLVAVGLVVMLVQFSNIAGSTQAHRIRQRFGESSVIYAGPLLIVGSLLMLAAFEVLPALTFIGVIGFTTAILRPVVMNRVQLEVPNHIRATVLSVQSLMFTFLIAIGEPILGVIADHAGLSAAYFALALTLGMFMLYVLWKGRAYFPHKA